MAAVNLLVCCSTASLGTDSEQTNFSAMVSPETVRLVDGSPMTSARFMRSVKTEEEKDDDKDDDKDDLESEKEKEERMMKLPSFKMLTPIDALLAQ